jgi:SNF2 family DNA or RNA helicase
LPLGYKRLYTREPMAALPHYVPGEDADCDKILAGAYADYKASFTLTGDPSKYQVPPGQELLPFQAGFIDYAMQRPHTLLGDEMGTGKTVQAIALANEMRARRMLIVCPANVRTQWAGMIRDWTMQARPSIYPIGKTQDGVSPSANWTIVSYDLTRSAPIYRALMKLDFDMMICDEAHALKTVDSGRSRQVLGDLRGEVEGLASRCERTLTMTGTPLPNRPRECYNLARHQCWEAVDWMSEDAFQHRFNPSISFGDHVEERTGRLPELHARLRTHFMCRRLLDDVQPQLPEMTCELTYLEPNGAINKVLRAEKLLDIDINQLDDADMTTRGHIAEVRHEMGLAKVPRILEHVRMLMDGGLNKVVLACYHRDVMDQLAEKLKAYGVASIRGGQTTNARDREKFRFIRDPECGVLLLQLNTAAGVDGLQEVCHQGVFVEASWVPGDNDQVMRRLKRMGQDKHSFWQFAVAPGSLDEKILGKHIYKSRTTGKVLDG